MPKPRVAIRPLREIPDFEALILIQREVWSHGELDVTPVHQFCVHVHTGAILLGAFVDGEPAGYVYSFPAVVGGRFCHHSHHLAVRPAFQRLGLGKRLKWAQRAEARRRGIRLITWTYEPLQARNANLNLHALGAVGRTYLRNFYGCTPALTLDEGVPTDRLLVEWPIASARVRARRESGGPPAPDPEALPKAVERAPGGTTPDIAPARPRLGLRDPRVLIEIPPDVRRLMPGTGLIPAWRAAVRAAFEGYFRRGYALDDFLFGERCYYVLKKRPLS